MHCSTLSQHNLHTVQTATRETIETKEEPTTWPSLALTRIFQSGSECLKHTQLLFTTVRELNVVWVRHVWFYQCITLREELLELNKSVWEMCCCEFWLGISKQCCFILHVEVFIVCIQNWHIFICKEKTWINESRDKSTHFSVHLELID